MEKEWTFDQPTKEGYYWIKEGIVNLEIVRVKKNLFEDTLCATFHGSGNISGLNYMKSLEWCGPITPPPTGTMKEKSLPDVPVPPLPSFSKEEVNEKSDS